MGDVPAWLRFVIVCGGVVSVYMAGYYGGASRDRGLWRDMIERLSRMELLLAEERQARKLAECEEARRKLRALDLKARPQNAGDRYGG